MADTISHDARWSEYPGEEWSDALVTAMKLGGVDHLFFVSGSEIAFWQESVARAKEKGWPTPKLITVPHESVALNAALGSAMIRNQPDATAVHVDVGTLNYGGAIHTAWRGNYPVLITAGTGPRLCRIHRWFSQQRCSVGTGAKRSGRDSASVHKNGPSSRASG